MQFRHLTNLVGFSPMIAVAVSVELPIDLSAVCRTFKQPVGDEEGRCDQVENGSTEISFYAFECHIRV